MKKTGSSRADNATDYGVLTAISGRLPDASSTALSQTLERLSQQTKLSTADLLLSWAYYRLGGIVVTSSSKAERLESTFQLLSARQGSVGNEVFDEIESAAERDGYGGKVFYGHPHMEKARLESVGKSE